MKFSKKALRFILILTVILSIICSYVPCSANNVTPPDISGKWYEQTVINAIQKGWVNGYEDGTFRGDNPITTAEFISLVNSVFNLSKNTEFIPLLNDVKPADWFYSDILTAYSNKLIPVEHVHEFNAEGICSCNVMEITAKVTYLDIKPNENISRENAIMILSRLPEIKEITDYTLALPADQNSSSDYAYGTVIKMYSLRIVKGNEKNRVNPQDNITRAEALALIERTYNYINGLLPEYIEPQFVVKEHTSFGKTSKGIYVLNTSDLYQYSFKSTFETPKELNYITTTASSDGITFTIDYSAEPLEKIIMDPTSKELKLFTFNTWQVYDAYKGYIPKKGDKITVKVTVTNDKKTITKDYFIDYIVE